MRERPSTKGGNQTADSLGREGTDKEQDLNMDDNSVGGRAVRPGGVSAGMSEATPQRGALEICKRRSSRRRTGSVREEAGFAFGRTSRVDPAGTRGRRRADALITL